LLRNRQVGSEAIIEELLKMVLSTRSVLRLYKEKQLPLQDSPRPAVRESSPPAARKKRNVHHWKSLASNETEDSRGLSLKSDSGQLSGVCSEEAPAKMEATEHGS
jgi:hypothetical protein